MTLNSKLGLGTVQFGMPYGISNSFGKTSFDEVSAILDNARQNGIKLIDTAFVYGNAEEVLGKNDLSSFDIVSKFRAVNPGESPLQQLEMTLNFLKVNTLYGYLAHRPNDILDFPIHWSDLQRAKKSGYIKKLGFSLNYPEEIEAILPFEPDLIQVPYNFLDRRFEGIMKECNKIGCEIHSRSAFLQGLFFVPSDSLPPFFKDVKPFIYELQQKETDELTGSLLNFVLTKTFINKVIIGVNNAKQLTDNLRSLRAATVLPDFIFTGSDDILIPSKWPKI